MKKIIPFLVLFSITILGCKHQTKDPIVQKSDSEIKVEKAYEKLSLPSVINSDVNSISLLDTLDGVSITWESLTPSVIANNGKVIHKDTDVNSSGKLKATLKYDNVTKTKEFNITVKNVLSEEKKLLLEAKDVLNIVKTVNATTNEITLPLKLSDAKFSNINVAWVTSNKDVITESGTVTHTSKETSDTVKLTAILSCNDKAEIKEFNVEVQNKIFSSDKQTLIDAINSFTFSITEVASDVNTIDLPVVISGKDNILISWSSSLPSVIDVDNKTVKHRDSLESDIVILKATFTLNNEKEVKDYTVEVKNNYTDQTLVNLCYDNLTIKTHYGEEEDEIRLSSKMTDYPGVSISWESSDKSVIDMSYGSWKVFHTVRAGTKTVKLTATITKGSVIKKKEFNITVENPTKTFQEKQEEQDTISVNKVVELLTIESVIDEYNGIISLPNKLYEEGTEGVSIQWESQDPSIITNDGKVSHNVGVGEKSVTLVAHIEKNYINATKSFTVTVKNPSSLPEENKVLDIAYNNLTLPPYSAMNEASETISLPSTVDVTGKKVDVSWIITSGPSSHIEIKDGVLILKRGISNISGVVKATLSYNNETKTKDISLFIPPFTYFDYSDEFNTRYIKIEGNVLEKAYQGTNTSSGQRYSIININEENNLLTLKKTHENRSGVWVDLETEKQQNIQQIRALKPIIEETKKNPTIDNVLRFMNQIQGSQGADPITEDDLYEQMIQINCFQGTVDYTEGEVTPNQIALAKALGDDVKGKAVLKFIDIYEEELKFLLGLNENNTWDDIINVLVQDMDNNNPAKCYKYTIIANDINSDNITDSINIEIKVAYDKAKKWYEQEGSYTQNVMSNNTTIHYYTDLKGRFSYPISETKMNDTDILIKEDGTSFTTETPNEKWTVTVDDKEETITVRNGTLSFKLFYDGKSIK